MRTNPKNALELFWNFMQVEQKKNVYSFNVLRGIVYTNLKFYKGIRVGNNSFSIYIYIDISHFLYLKVGFFEKKFLMFAHISFTRNKLDECCFAI